MYKISNNSELVRRAGRKMAQLPRWRHVLFLDYHPCNVYELIKICWVILDLQIYIYKYIRLFLLFGLSEAVIHLKPV